MNPERDTSASRRIEILREDVSKKIAAGEVIDRPFSVIRELLDNSIDAGADAVDVYIEGGGITRIAVVDNGSGMSREDLLLCSERHATSKIREEGDLYRVRTLGFRGEALASVAACSRLEVISKGRAGQGAADAPAYRLRVEGGKRLGVEQWRGNPGTVVTVSELFFNLPVRRKFLKSTAAETGTCRQTFLEKAVAHPAVTFRFFTDHKLKTFLPAQGQKQRVAAAFALSEEHLSLLEANRPSLNLSIVAARPELARRDKRLIQIYVNRRRIFEYSLVHAVEYAFGRYLPGGQHPAAFVFLDLDPQLVDFNIHPAKREARFRDLPFLHRLISETLQEYLSSFDLRASRSGTASEVEGSFPFREARRAAGSGYFPNTPELERLSTGSAQFPVERIQGAPGPGGVRTSRPSPETAGAAPGTVVEPVYRGQLFKLFLLVEYGDSLFIVDQHAAHERILFDQLQSGAPATQELLMPIRLEIGAKAADMIGDRRELFQRLGIRIELGDDDTYEITALPEALISIEEEELIQALLWEKGSVDELVERVFSLASCRLAVKEGRELDSVTAAELIRRVFQLPNARCPHGRPIWFQVSQDQLLREVGRI
ncbi:MAG: DNA mismatch repair endonuclease MutL [Spirochaetaceae bacterium]|nr:MAG: DNA mismatch repair endonuclease MutL [Spirochaetaceae bacterium]